MTRPNLHKFYPERPVATLCLAVLICFVCAFSPVVFADQKRDEDNFYRKLQGVWSGVRLGRDLDYWRAPERTPGSLVCESPAAEEVWVSCENWPDGSDARRFGMDAVRLSAARSDHEKALAVYRWVRRWMIYPNKNGCPIEHLNPSVSGHPRVHQADKLLNVYGVHWCGGQARAVEQVWRALGYQAEKVVRGGHTIVGMRYADYDGMERWHGLDVSHSAVAWHDSYRRLLSLDELSSQWYAFFYQYGLPGNGHIYFNDHRMELSLRRGESLERLWSNIGKPYQDNVASGTGMARKVPEDERGPYYPFTYGNGTWRYIPDLSGGDWQSGLAEPPAGMALDKPQPAAVGKPATATWHFRSPYIISDAEVHLGVFKKSSTDIIRLYLSVDNGQHWQRVWQCPKSVTGKQDVVAAICPKFDVAEKGPVPPADFASPFGRYSYRLKLELLATENTSDCRVESISFENTVQLNIYSLPQLQPGKNKIAVRGALKPGEALRVIYVWDDSAGKSRRNVTLVEETPHTYEIVAAGQNWKDCVCKSITIEGVPATGKGNRTLVKEQPKLFAKLPSLAPVAETTGRWNGQPLEKDLPRLQDVLAAAAEVERFRRVLRGAVMLGDTRTFDAFKELAYAEPSWNDKFLGFAGMYRADPERARSVLLDILNDREGARVVRSNGKDKKDEGWGREYSWCAGGTVIGYIAAEAQWEEFLPGLLNVLASDQCKSGWGPRYGTVRVIGLLGKGNHAAAGAIRDVLEHTYRREHGDTLVAAAMAAGRIGDSSSVPALRTHILSPYWPLKHNAALSLGILGDSSIVPLMHQWLEVKFDENFRGYAAEALGHLADAESEAHLRDALDSEPFPWVRRKIDAALKRVRCED